MNSKTKIAAMIVAAGRGTRAGGKIPKQWQTLMGKPLIAWSIETFLKNSKISQVVVVYHPDDKDFMKQLSGDIRG
tara:strand:+ start:465 stop:689 length:225 start_codon:yes stop_codon:yes gene_type:complete